MNMKVEYSEQFKNLIKVWDKAVIQKEKHAQYTLASFYLKLQTEASDKKRLTYIKNPPSRDVQRPCMH